MTVPQLFSEQPKDRASKERASQDAGAIGAICGLRGREPDLLGQAAACPVLEVGHLLSFPLFCNLASAASARPARKSPLQKGQHVCCAAWMLKEGEVRKCVASS